MISKTAAFKIFRGTERKTDEAIRQFVEGVRINEPRTLAYESYKQSDGLSYIHVMSFADAEAERFHRETSHMKTFVEALYPLCDEQPVFTDLVQVASSKPTQR